MSESDEHNNIKIQTVDGIGIEHDHGNPAVGSFAEAENLEIQTLALEVAELSAENERLRAENSQLRAWLRATPNESRCDQI